MHFSEEKIYNGFLKMILLICVFIFGCAGSPLLCWLFSSCSEQELVSSCSVWASHCCGFSCSGAWLLGVQASVVATHQLS